jgi:hypothetical protein
MPFWSLSMSGRLRFRESDRIDEYSGYLVGKVIDEVPNGSECGSKRSNPTYRGKRPYIKYHCAAPH